MPTFEVMTDVIAGALTARLYADRQASQVESGIALTELADKPGVYRGTTTRTGWHQIGVFDAAGPVAYWDVLLSAGHVALGEDRPHSLWPPAATGAAVSLPVPDAAQVTAYVVCRAPTGATQAGVEVRCAVHSVTDESRQGTAWAESPQVVVSNSQGVAAFLLSAESGIEYRAWRADGVGRVFTVTGSGPIQIPDLVG